MTKLSDVNSTDIVDAIKLGCRTMCNVFNRDDDNIPYGGAKVRPEAVLSISSESHIPGRHLDALLNAMDAVNVDIGETCINNHERAAFLSYSGSVALPCHRSEQQLPPNVFEEHNVREGFHALTALVRFRQSDRARLVGDASIACILEHWDLVNGWDYDRLQKNHKLRVLESSSFISGLARSIGALVKYYRATDYDPALHLASVLKDKCVQEFFDDHGTYDVSKFGPHCHSTTCVMSSLAQLSDVTNDRVLLETVKAFYDNGLWDIRNELGWSPESSDPQDNSGRGEANNTGDILETAMILARSGYSGYYDDAEKILRCHLLPSQLRDISFIEETFNSDGVDGKRDVANRLLGSFGFPAPYGHEPFGIMRSNKPRIGFNPDIVGGVVSSLVESFKEIYRLDHRGHWVNMLFDHENENIKIQSPYTNTHLGVMLKIPRPLFLRIPSWVNRRDIKISGENTIFSFNNEYLHLRDLPVGEFITIEFPLVARGVTIKHGGSGELMTKFIGDQVIAMDNLGADLTFFDAL